MKFEFQTSFREHYIATLTVLSRGPLQIVLSAIFPLAGILLLFLNLAAGSLGLINMMAVVLCFGFTTLLTALNVWIYRRRNRTSIGQFVYEFDQYGIRVSGGVFELCYQSGVSREETRCRESR
jgi:hypothetical protein